MTESNNPLVRAKQEAALAVQELITKDETVAARLEQIAEEISTGHAAFTELKDRTALEEGRLVAEAFKLVGGGISFNAWWDNPDTWENVAGMQAPFGVRKAYDVKRLHDFCSGAIVGKSVGRPKNPEGFSTEAISELIAPKYLKDHNGKELNESKDERTEGSQKRLDVVEKVYGRLKKRARDRKQSAAKKGGTAAPITKKEALVALKDEFEKAGTRLVVAPRQSSSKPLSWWLEEARTEMERYYYVFETDPEGLAAMRGVIEQELSVWAAKQEEQQ